MANRRKKNKYKPLKIKPKSLIYKDGPISFSYEERKQYGINKHNDIVLRTSILLLSSILKSDSYLDAPLKHTKYIAKYKNLIMLDKSILTNKQMKVLRHLALLYK